MVWKVRVVNEFDQTDVVLPQNFPNADVGYNFMAVAAESEMVTHIGAGIGADRTGKIKYTRTSQLQEVRFQIADGTAIQWLLNEV